MKEGDLTPIFIIEQIFEARYEHNYLFDIDNSGPAWVFADKTAIPKRELPTFKEDEWTGILLKKASFLASRVELTKSYGFWFCKLIGKHKENFRQAQSTQINHAIILAIAEAKGL